MTVTSNGWLVGTAAVVDLEAACALYGRESLPDPLGRSRPVGSVWLLSRDTGPIENRLNGGDLHAAREWVQAVLRTEAFLACRVSFTDADTPDVRVHALRTGESGYVAVQRIAADGIDVVDIVEVAPHALGLAVAESVGLVGAGGRIRIAVTGGGRLPAPPETVDEYDDFGLLIPSAEPRDTALQLIDGRELVAVGVVQSWHDPDRRWDGDANRQTLQWVQVSGDGDYLYSPGGVGDAEPMDLDLLRACIDRTVAG